MISPDAIQQAQHVAGADPKPAYKVLGVLMLALLMGCDVTSPLMVNGQRMVVCSVQSGSEVTINVRSLRGNPIIVEIESSGQWTFSSSRLQANFPQNKIDLIYHSKSFHAEREGPDIRFHEKDSLSFSIYGHGPMSLPLNMVHDYLIAGGDTLKCTMVITAPERDMITGAGRRMIPTQ